jgi:hypothetical protein
MLLGLLYESRSFRHNVLSHSYVQGKRTVLPLGGENLLSRMRRREKARQRIRLFKGGHTHQDFYSDLSAQRYLSKYPFSDLNRFFVHTLHRLLRRYVCAVQFVCALEQHVLLNIENDNT